MDRGITPVSAWGGSVDVEGEFSVAMLVESERIGRGLEDGEEGCEGTTEGDSASDGDAGASAWTAGLDAELPMLDKLRESRSRTGPRAPDDWRWLVEEGGK